MRTNFNENLKKVKASKRSGSGTEDVYVPTYEHYDELLFTMGDDDPRKGISSVDLNKTIVDFEKSKKSTNSSAKKGKSDTTPPPSHAQKLLDNAIEAFKKNSTDDTEVSGCLMILKARLNKLTDEEKTVAIMDLLSVKSTFPKTN